MSPENFTYLVVNPIEIGANHLNELKHTASKFPYCAIIHSLIAKSESENFSQSSVSSPIITKAAAYSLSRNALRLLLSNEIQNPISFTYAYKNNKTIEAPKTEKVIANISIPKPQTLKINVTRRNHESLDKLKGLDYTQLIPQQNIQGNFDTKAGGHYQWELIDKFIEAQPRIKPIKSNKGGEDFFANLDDLTVRSSPQNLDLVTESFAKTMAKTGNLKLAVETYEKLMLKNPIKKTYFATKITEIKSKAENS